MARLEQHGLDVILARQPFFQDMTPEHLALLGGCASNVRFDDGDYLFHEGDPADRFYLIREGRIAIEMTSAERGPLVIQTVETSSVLGYSWLIPPHRWQFHGRAIGTVRAVAMDGVCMRGKCEADHDLGYAMMQRFAALMVERFTASRIQLLDLYGEERA